MKKIIGLLALLAVFLAAAPPLGAVPLRNEPILNPTATGPYSATNAACALCYTNTEFGGLRITNAAAAPLGGFTNISSWISASLRQTTNGYGTSWTNRAGTWVIPTNNTPGSVTGISFVTNDTTQLMNDIPLWVDGNGGFSSILNPTNNWDGGGNSFPISAARLQCRWNGDASTSGTLNLIFVGIPGSLEDTTTPPTFQWGIAVAAGPGILSTNLPIWKFAGCSKMRLKSATLTQATAANIGVVIDGLTFHGFLQ